MHVVKSVCYFLFAVNVAAVPFNQTLGLEARDVVRNPVEQPNYTPLSQPMASYRLQEGTVSLLN